MITPDAAPETLTVGQTVRMVAQEFYLKAPAIDDKYVEAPASYQKNEPGFRPFRAGKASAAELQNELDKLLAHAEETSTDLGIENEASLQKLLIQQGLGIDCSNLAFRALTAIHAGINAYGKSFSEHVYWQTADVQDLVADNSWQPLDEAGQTRSFNQSEKLLLSNEDPDAVISVAALCEIFGKDSEFIIGTKHLCSDASSVEIQPEQLLSGDLIAFHDAHSENIVHVGVIENVAQRKGATEAAFWHSWHSRDFHSGLRRDEFTLTHDGFTWSHPGLNNSRRYSGYALRSPNMLAGEVS